MDDDAILRPPESLAAIRSETLALGFTMESSPRTGSLLRTLAASKRSARILELGTGTGMGTCWMADGMDRASRLVTVDEDESVLSVAKRHLGMDSRIEFRIEDGKDYLVRARGRGESFDLIFADAWPGKFHHLEEALRLLAPGGWYIIDDLLPQASWPEDHAPKVAALIDQLRRRAELELTEMAWSSGILIATKRGEPWGTA